jgi:type VI secretion system protein ImpE
MTPPELVRAGKLSEALSAMVADVRDPPADVKKRTFLFELLCFAGQYDRAEKHLNLLAQATPDAEFGALLYRSALTAQRKREALLASGDYPGIDSVKPSLPGALNGKPFGSLEDLDPRIGPRLEMFVAGEYVWLPFEHIGSIHVAAPRYLRDTLWAVATVQTGPSFQGQNFGEVLIPMLAPFSWQHERDDVKLGHSTDWKEQGGQLIPFGQKLLVVDEETAIPFLEIRDLRFEEASVQSGSESVGASGVS